jgi:hypothetical protein
MNEKQLTVLSILVILLGGGTYILLYVNWTRGMLILTTTMMAICAIGILLACVGYK